MPPEFSQLLQASLGADKAIDEDDPYAPMQRGARTIDEALLQHAQQGSIGQGIAAALLSGAFGGVSDNLSRGYHEDQNAAVQAALPDVLNGRAISQGNMGPSVFNRLQQEGAIRKVEEAKSQQDLQDEINARIKEKAAPTYADLHKSPSGYSPEFKIAHKIDPEASDAEVRATLHEDEKTGIQPKQKDALNQGESIINQLDDLAPKLGEIKKLGDNNAMRAIKSFSLDTPEGKYQNTLQRLSDQLAFQFGHRVSWASIKQQLDALSLRQLGSVDAFNDILSGVKASLRRANEGEASTYSNGPEVLQTIRDTQTKATPKKADYSAAPPGLSPEQFKAWKASR